MAAHETLLRDEVSSISSCSSEDERRTPAGPAEGAEDPSYWTRFWQSIATGSASRTETIQTLSDLCEAPPQASVLSACLQSLDAFQPAATDPAPGTVNVVGTGGGPSTFNITTASAFVAAEMGATVIKTGSRAYKSQRGSVDMLEQLGIRMSSTQSDIARSVKRSGMAFAGPHVYPKQLRQLARHLYPTDLKPYGNFLNAIGPFIADVPVRAQVTGVSDRLLAEELRSLLDRFVHRRVWLLRNKLGIDELIGGVDNDVLVGPTRQLWVPAGTLRWDADYAQALASRNTSEAVAHFQSVLAGQGTEAEMETVAINAAIVALAAECEDSFEAARHHALRVLDSGAALNRLFDIRQASARSS